MGHARLAFALPLAAALALGACVGSGSDVGPQLSDLPQETQSGSVMDPEGRPISDARVSIGNGVQYTDRRGRFQFPQNPAGTAIVHVDARLTTTVGGPGIFDTIAVAGAFTTGKGSFPAPIVLPNFALGASGTFPVNQGTALAGTLTDPATGAELVLDGAVATLPGVGATAATIRFVSLPADAVSAPLDAVGATRAGALYFAIAPEGLQFSVSPVVRVGDATFGVGAADAAGAPIDPELDRLNDASGSWTKVGDAAVAGGFLATGAVVRGGLHALSVVVPAQGRTIVQARVLDRELDPLPKSLALARDGLSARADDDGALAIPNVCAADANGAALPVSLTVVAPYFRSQHSVRRATLPGVPGVGLVTDFGDRPQPTVPAGVVRLLPIYRGKIVLGARVGVASAFGGDYAEESFSTSDGIRLPDVPTGQVAACATAGNTEKTVIRAVRTFSFKNAGAVPSLNIFLESVNAQSSAHQGILRVIPVREGSGAPLYGVFGILGISPFVPQQFLADGIQGQLQPVKKGLAYTTATHQFDVSGLGTDVDAFRKVAFATQVSDAAIRRPVLDSEVDRLPKGFDPAGRASGLAVGLTDPASVPPSQGHYSVEPRARRADGFEARLAVALGAQRDPIAAVPPGGVAPSAGAPAFDLLVPVGPVVLALVERDTAAAGSFEGAIRSFGLSQELQVEFGSESTFDVVLDGVTSDALASTVSGSVPSAFQATLVAELSADLAVDLGDQSAFTYDGGTGALTVAVPPTPNGRSAAALTSSGTTAAGAAFFTSAAAVEGEAGGAQFLALPELVLAAPPPPGTPPVISPTGDGFTWVADPNTSETLLTITRESTSIDSLGVKRKTGYSWNVRIPGAVPFPFRLPATPPNFGNKTLPVFFESGAVYALQIEARRYTNYQERVAATSNDAVPASYFGARAVARTAATFQVP